MNEILTDADAIKCLDFIRDKAKPYAVAKSQVRQLDQWRKIKRSEEFLKAQGSVAERQAIAETSKAYIDAVKAMEEPETIEAQLKWQLIAAQEKLNIYRTMSANERKATQ